MYKCLDCGHIFDEPKQYSEDRTPGGAFDGGSFIEHYTGCPFCGGSFTTAMKCQGCDEYISIEDDYPFCTDCINNILSKFATIMQENFREDEYDVIINHLDDVVPYKGE
jgi:rubredoxin